MFDYQYEIRKKGLGYYKDGVYHFGLDFENDVEKFIVERGVVIISTRSNIFLYTEDLKKCLFKLYLHSNIDRKIILVGNDLFYETPSKTVKVVLFDHHFKY